MGGAWPFRQVTFLMKKNKISLSFPFFWVLFFFLSLDSSAAIRENGTAILSISLNSSYSGKNSANSIGSEEVTFDDFENEFEEPLSENLIDPLSGYNRIMTTFNDKFYFWLAKPVAKGYKYIVPEGGRLAIGRFFNNLLFPVRFVNNTLQFKFKAAGIELGRFCINSTAGILGFWDPAKEWLEWEAYPEDFGQTLGYYGVGGGFHIVLPILGPSNLRDSLSLIPDYFLEPVSLVEPDLDELAVKSYDKLNFISLHIGEYESIKKDAIDLYPFLRDAYEQNRKKKIEE